MSKSDYLYRNDPAKTTHLDPKDPMHPGTENVTASMPPPVPLVEPVQMKEGEGKENEEEKSSKLQSLDLSASVGKDGPNKAKDVKVMQQALLQLGLPVPKSEIDLVNGKKPDDTLDAKDLKFTLDSMGEFQWRFLDSPDKQYSAGGQSDTAMDKALAGKKYLQDWSGKIKDNIPDIELLKHQYSEAKGIPELAECFIGKIYTEPRSVIELIKLMSSADKACFIDEVIGRLTHGDLIYVDPVLSDFVVGQVIELTSYFEEGKVKSFAEKLRGQENVTLEAHSLDKGVKAEKYTLEASGDTLNLKVNGEKVDPQLSLSKIRNAILSNYNWSGIVQLMKEGSSKTCEFDYVTPTDLKGNDSDNVKIIPDQAIKTIVLLEMQYKYEVNPQYYITGKPIGFFVSKILGDGSKTGEEARMDLMDQREDAGENQLSIINPSTFTSGGANQEDMYKNLRNIVLKRNGLWSDEDEITNVISLRNSAEVPEAQQKDEENKNENRTDHYSVNFNDFFFVAWKVGDTYNVTKYEGSTEPGDLDCGMILPDQTLTMYGGLTWGKEPSGRTKDFMRKDKLSDTETYNKGDSGMNFHRANVSGGKGTSDKIDENLKTVEGDDEFEAYRVLMELYYLLSKRKINKFEDLTEDEIKEDKDYSRIQELFNDFSNHDLLDTDLKDDLKEKDFSSMDYSQDLVKNWSTGCQTVPSTEEFYTMMNDIEQFSGGDDDSGQRRWYYTIIDLETLNTTTATGNIDE